jgi:hypothetical protein
MYAKCVRVFNVCTCHMRPAPSNRLAEGPLGGCWGPPYNNGKSVYGASVCTLLWYISVVGFVVVFAAFITDSENLSLCHCLQSLGRCICFRVGLCLEHNLDLERQHHCVHCLLVVVLAKSLLLS